MISKISGAEKNRLETGLAVIYATFLGQEFVGLFLAFLLGNRTQGDEPQGEQGKATRLRYLV